MLKRFHWIVLLTLVMGAAQADPSARYRGYGAPSETMNVMTDVLFLRPMGFVGTLAGTVLFIAATPFTALASIAEPHDAFPRVANILIGGPVFYTFRRPVGVLCLGQAYDDERQCDW